VGIFFDTTVRDDVDDGDESRRGGERRRPAPRVEQTLQWKRLLFALAILGVLIAAAVGTEAASLDASSKALWGLSASILGLIVGLVGGEKSS
jgi:hypothetical protein